MLCGVLSEGYQSGQAGPSGTVHNHQRADYKRAGRNYEKEKDNLRARPARRQSGDPEQSDKRNF